ncbi:PREDICTED: E3 ubiquitin-protein ligase KCMF1-like [Priapulus caudatus]|uniref:RING-type E3 ubiquitin transferase n=1 Tax=Priapulus caudatus TaxID=37621 RepID=A0ABM1ET14_PRICU|nr:PREDICTED: E3 ubiquitin-protein ligase KCMF1-like [Priapulus caudatus]
MSRHEGVSCDSCLKGNFRGRRYKCLVCYDYDLCDTCYEAGATTSHHLIHHPMQCIVTRSDFELYYGGETLLEQPQSFTCPFCSRMGFTEAALQDHVTSEHPETTTDVVCPVCASLPGGEPNHVTDDFAAHLALEHRAPRDLISFQDEPASSRHVRRIPHPGRGVTTTRARRSNMHFGNSSGISILSPGNRDAMDPIAELLSQLSGVRRSSGLGAGTGGSAGTGTAQQNNTSSQLQQLQVQLQLERQQAQMARQHLERLPRRQASTNSSSASTYTLNSVALDSTTSERQSSTSSQYLLVRHSEPTLSDADQAALEVERADHSQFVQELLLSALASNLVLDDDFAEFGEGLADVGQHGPSTTAGGFAVPPQASGSKPVPPKRHVRPPLQPRPDMARIPGGSLTPPGSSGGGGGARVPSIPIMMRDAARSRPASHQPDLSRPSAPCPVGGQTANQSPELARPNGTRASAQASQERQNVRMSGGVGGQASQDVRAQGSMLRRSAPRPSPSDPRRRDREPPPAPGTRK